MNKYKTTIVVLALALAGMFFLSYFYGEQKPSEQSTPKTLLDSSPHPTIFIPDSVKPDSASSPDTTSSTKQ